MITFSFVVVLSKFFIRQKYRTQALLICRTIKTMDKNVQLLFKNIKSPNLFRNGDTQI